MLIVCVHSLLSPKMHNESKNVKEVQKKGSESRKKEKGKGKNTKKADVSYRRKEKKPKEKIP